MFRMIQHVLPLYDIARKQEVLAEESCFPITAVQEIIAKSSSYETYLVSKWNLWSLPVGDQLRAFHFLDKKPSKNDNPRMFDASHRNATVSWRRRPEIVEMDKNRVPN